MQIDSTNADPANPYNRKTQTGIQPMEYLNYIRINKAVNPLGTGSYNILEAAFESG